MQSLKSVSTSLKTPATVTIQLHQLTQAYSHSQKLKSLLYNISKTMIGNAMLHEYHICATVFLHG